MDVDYTLPLQHSSARTDKSINQLGTIITQEVNIINRQQRGSSLSSSDPPSVDTAAFLTTLAHLAYSSIPSKTSSSTTNSRSIPYLSHHITLYHLHLLYLRAQLNDYRFLSSQSARRPLSSLEREASSIESQWKTWLLLRQVREAEEISQEKDQIVYDESRSDRNKALRILKEDSIIMRNLSVVHWLEEISAADSSSEFEQNGDVSFKRSLRKLQTSRNMKQTDPSPLDIDVEFRLKDLRLDPNDVEEEDRLLSYCWLFIRAGKLNEAIELCKSYGQYWRAVSFNGGQLWHDDPNDITTKNIGQVGNKKRFLWKESCRRLAQNSRTHRYEAAIYGLLGSSLLPLLSACLTWEDCVWALFKVLVDIQMDKKIAAEIKDQDEIQYANKIDKNDIIMDSKESAEDLFRRLEIRSNSYLPSSARSTASDIYHQLQRLIILSKYQEAEVLITEYCNQYFSHWIDPEQISHSLIQTSGTDESFLVFSVSLYLHFHPLCPTSEPLNSNGQILVRAYFHYLQSLQKLQLLPLYAIYFPANIQIDEYAAVLVQLNGDTRKDMLHLAQLYFPENSLALTKEVVERVRQLAVDKDNITSGITRNRKSTLLLTSGDMNANMEDVSVAASRLSVSGSTSSLFSRTFDTQDGDLNITASDLEMIRSLDCFEIVSATDFATITEAMLQANQLYRFFILSDRYASAKKLTESLARKKFDQFVALTPLSSSSPTAARISHEYASWKVYIISLTWYEAWVQMMSAKPKATINHSTKSSANAKKQLDKQLKDWQVKLTEVVSSSVSAILSCLQLEGGWMRQVSNEEAEVLSKIRTKCVPTLIFQLHKICFDSDQGLQCLQIIDLVADERFQLYADFPPADLQALLQTLRNSYIRFQLADDETFSNTIQPDNNYNNNNNNSTSSQDIKDQEEEIDKDTEIEEDRHHTVPESTPSIPTPSLPKQNIDSTSKSVGGSTPGRKKRSAAVAAAAAITTAPTRRVLRSSHR